MFRAALRYRFVILRSSYLVHSSINDNWLRLSLMHSIARNFYATTEGTDFRNRISGRGNVFPFDANAYDEMTNESAIVGMVMAWAVVTLESLANHQLAEVLNNRILATMAIEYPAQVTDKIKASRCARSELAKKLIILTDAGVPVSTIKLADTLVDIRNSIVHDKPFRLSSCEDGDVNIEWYRARDDAGSRFVRYEELTAFYKDCETVKDCILNASSESIDCKVNFSELLAG